MTDVSSQGVGVEVGPGGVRVGPTDRRVRRGPDCRELRAACLNKERLGEQGRATAVDTAAFAASLAKRRHLHLCLLGTAGLCRVRFAETAAFAAVASRNANPLVFLGRLERPS
jgi:hypothetical protein